MQLLFTWNPFLLQSSRFSLEYLLLPPRSALTEAPAGPAPAAFDATVTTLLLVAARRTDTRQQRRPGIGRSL